MCSGSQDFGLYTEYCTNYSKGNEYLEQSLATSSDLQTFILVNNTTYSVYVNTNMF